MDFGLGQGKLDAAIIADQLAVDYIGDAHIEESIGVEAVRADLLAEIAKSRSNEFIRVDRAGSKQEQAVNNP